MIPSPYIIACKNLQHFCTGSVNITIWYRSFRIVWLLEEIGIPYEIKKYERTKEQLAPKELLAVHPLGKSPVITDGELTIAETGLHPPPIFLHGFRKLRTDMKLQAHKTAFPSTYKDLFQQLKYFAGAIVEYLVSKYASDKLSPPQSDEALSVKYKYWLHFAEGSAMTPVLLALLFGMTEKNAPFFIRPIARAISGGVYKFYSKLSTGRPCSSFKILKAGQRVSGI